MKIHPNYFILKEDEYKLAPANNLFHYSKSLIYFYKKVKL